MSDAAEAPSAPRSQARVVDLDWRAALVAAIALVLLIVGRDLASATSRTLTWAAIAGLLALALNPLVGAAQRRLRTRRGVAIALVLAGFMAAVAGVGLLLGPAAAQQARDLQQELPDVIERLDDLPVIGERLRENDVPEKVQTWIEDLPARLAGDTTPIEGWARTIVGGVLAAGATVALTVAMLLDGERIVRGARRAVPLQHRPRADRMGDLFYRIVGRYFAGSLFVALVAGIATLIVGTVLQVPLTPLLAVNVALFDLVPQIGGAAGGIPFVALAFTESPTTGVICGVFFMLYLQFENNVLQPIVIGDAVDLSPPATMLGALVGVSLAGVPGALIAIPLLGATKAIYLEFRPAPAHDTPTTAKGKPGLLRRLVTRVLRPH